MENIDQSEVSKFDKLAARWWEPDGDLWTLHAINPLRMRFITDQVSLADKKAVDVGCGGGILTETLALAKADCTGVDMSEEALKVAKLHALDEGLDIQYVHSTIENFAETNPAAFDVVTCLELIEHVPDPSALINACAKLLKPGGHLFISTLNRNLKAYLQAIIGAEYILGILPKGTHDFEKFIKPSELEAALRASGCQLKTTLGISYNPFTKQFSTTPDISVNYLVHAVKQ